MFEGCSRPLFLSCLSVFCQAEHVYTQMFAAPRVSAGHLVSPPSALWHLSPARWRAGLCVTTGDSLCATVFLTHTLPSPRFFSPFRLYSLSLRGHSVYPSHPNPPTPPLTWIPSSRPKRKNQNLMLHCGRSLVRTQPSVFARLPANFESKQI